MPESGHLPMPSYLLRQGVTDMVRISDARMSGTGFGTVVLHVAPESAIGGPLALVRTGDRIRLDTAAGDSTCSSATRSSRRGGRAWVPRPSSDVRGYRGLYVRTVMQADRGLRPRLPRRRVSAGPGRDHARVNGREGATSGPDGYSRLSCDWITSRSIACPARSAS